MIPTNLPLEASSQQLCCVSFIQAISAAKACQKSRDEAESDGEIQGRDPAWLTKLMARVSLEGGSVPSSSRRGGAAAAPTNPLAGGLGSPAAVMPAGPLCIVCEEDRANVMVQPCGHLCLCSACASGIQRSGNACPMCRKDIGHVQTVYY